jgi:hypothetical protein
LKTHACPNFLYDIHILNTLQSALLFVQNYFCFGKCLAYLPCIKFAESKVSNPFDLAKSAAPAPTNTHGGTRPRVPSILCPRHISLATLQGFFSPPAAPTAPQSLEAPSITEASHSTVPSQVRFDPYPAFVNELSSKMATASVAASNADFPSEIIWAPYEKII